QQRRPRDRPAQPKWRKCDSPLTKLPWGRGERNSSIADFVIALRRHVPGLKWSISKTFMAALWPGIPLTAPPRRALEPQMKTFGNSVSIPHEPIVSLFSAKGNARAA